MTLPPKFHTFRLFKKYRHPAQGLVEFALALPVLLLLLFGVIEFGRFLQAWLALENGARFGVRYAITGNFDPQYCDDAGAALGLTVQMVRMVQSTARFQTFPPMEKPGKI